MNKLNTEMCIWCLEAKYKLNTEMCIWCLEPLNKLKKEMYLGTESHEQVKIKYVYFFIFIKYNHLCLIIKKIDWWHIFWK
jgi:hypothetical protein